MRVHPVIEDAATVVTVVAESMSQPLSFHSELDVDVYRLHRVDAGSDGPDLVARVIGPSVARANVDAAVHVLERLAGTRFPAERCPSAHPVLVLGADRHVLVTEYVEPSPAPGPGFVLAWCAGLLSRLAARSGGDLPAGGGWHRLGPTPSSEIDQALVLGGQIGPSVAELVEALAVGLLALRGRPRGRSPSVGPLRRLGPAVRGGTRAAAGGHDCPTTDPRALGSGARTHDGAPGGRPFPRASRPCRSDHRDSE